MSMASSITSIQPGWDVIGSDGSKVGDVAEVAPNYLLVTKGTIFVKDIYIPTSAIESLDDGRVHLNVPKDGIEDLGWDEPPTGQWTSGSEGVPSAEGATDQYAYTETDQAGATQTIDTSAGSYAQPETSYEQPQTTDTDNLRVQRVEEDLAAQKTQAEVGEVVVRKDVVEEQQTLDVPVMREEVQVRSSVVDRPADQIGTDDLQGGETLRIPIREEQVQVTKQPRVVEELEIEKVATQETEQVSDTVRREQVHVEEGGQTRNRDLN